MDRADAKLICEAGDEAVIASLIYQCEQIKKLQKKVASLQKDSTNSSKPPSFDGPKTKKPNKKRTGKRKQGGQPGHKGKKRELLPVEQMDDVYELFPSQCEKCDDRFSKDEKIITATPSRHQWFELPRIKMIMEEFRCHTLTCKCGHRTTAKLPEHVAVSSFGPRLHAAIAYLSVAYKIPRRGISDIFKNFFDLDLALGSTCNVASRVADACKPVAEQIKSYIKNALNLNIDETGWKNKLDRRYLWTFVADLCVYFVIAASRGSIVLEEVLGPVFHGVIGSDDHSAYNKYHKKGRRQLCWAHLIRKLKGLKDARSSPDAYIFAKNMLKETGRLFTYWHAYKEADCSLQELYSATNLIRARIKKYCLMFRDSEDAAVRTRARRTLKNWPFLFTFLLVEGVEPTNNIAERAFRHAVIWRRICFGSQSDYGERFVERLLSIIGTCKIQNRNPLDFLTEIMEARLMKKPLPELIFSRLPN